MTPERIREIEGAANAASEGPWKVDRVPFEGPHKPREPADVQGPCGLIVTCESGYDNQAANCRFIASARTDVPELVAEVKRLKQILAAKEFASDETNL